jgi:methionine aminopeptidase
MSIIVTYMWAFCREIADKYRYGVVEHFVGHGVGEVFHSAPSILHNHKGSPPSCRIQPSYAPLELLGRWLIVD